MNILIVDDHPVVISGCRALLEAVGACEITAARDGEEALRLYATCRPAMVVIDVNLPDMSGFDLAARVLGKDPEASLLFFSMNEDPLYVARAREVGAKGFVSKNDDPEQLRAAVAVVADGGTWFPERAGRSALAGVALAPREVEILRLLAKGRSMSEIAGLINVSYKTVAGLCAAMRTKLNARTPMELVRIAVEQKIV